MAELTTNKRKKLAASAFGLPSERKYPIPDKSHAANAKARATQGVTKGTLSPGAAAKIRAKANKILGRGKPKGDNDMDEGVKGLAASDRDGDELL